MEEVSLAEVYCHMMDRSLYRPLLKLYVGYDSSNEADGTGETGYCSCVELPTWCSRFRVSYNLQEQEWS
jgi:hypothetical protein